MMLVGDTKLIAALAAITLAGIAGLFAWKALEAWQRKKRHRAALEAEEGASERYGSSFAQSGRGASWVDRIIAMTVDQSRKSELQRDPLWKKPLGLGGSAETLLSSVRAAGLEGRVTPAGSLRTKAMLSTMLGAIGGVGGMLFSPELAMVLLLVGMFLGWQAPAFALKRRIEERSQDMERHLPEMLDVIALGMRSGLSFDMSLKLYGEHFDTTLARELVLAQTQWSCGLEQRERALRNVAASYDSAVFARVVDTIVRSIRFGSSMAESLEVDAADARAAYRARREEKIAKAPVKMMIPTGTLILPAMLVMVMGPVLLELIGGGI